MNMKLENWDYFFKKDTEGNWCPPQQTYEPLISPDRKTFCANYEPNNYYQNKFADNVRNYKEVAEYFFDKEVQFLKIFEKEDFAPNNIHIDYKNLKIFFDWHDNCCNHSLYPTQINSIDTWLNQLHKIIKRQFSMGVYKLSQYPHCHFIDKQGEMKAFDFYASTEIDNIYVDKRYIDAIISRKSEYRIKEQGVTVNNEKVDLEKMFKNGLQTHIQWGVYSLEFIYKDLFDG